MGKTVLALGVAALALLAVLWWRGGARGVDEPAKPRPADAKGDDGRAADLIAAAPPTEAARTESVAAAAPPAAATPRANPALPFKEGGLSLHVRDADMGRELAPVFVLELERRRAPPLYHPGPIGERAEERGASPIALDLLAQGLTTVFARSPGYAWGRIEFAAGDTERFLDLERGGAVRVRVVGGPRDPGTMLRVFPSGNGGVEPAHEAASDLLLELEIDRTDELVIDGLRASQVEVAAQIGRIDAPRSLARETVEVVAGATTNVTLALEPSESARWVALAGSLVLPPEWELDDFVLVFQLQGPALERWPGRVVVSRVEMTLAEREAGLYTWQADDVQPGTYSVSLAALGYAGEVEVGPEGNRDVRVAIGAPCEVRVRCVQGTTKEPVHEVRLAWGSVSAPPAALVPVTDPDVDGDGFEFRAPRGEIRIDAVSPDFEPQSRVFELRPGRNELELELQPIERTGVRLTLRDGATDLAWDVRALPTLEPLDGQPPARGRFRKAAFELLTEKPGRYRLRVPRIAGYLPVPERVLDVMAGEVTDVVLELARER